MSTDGSYYDVNVNASCQPEHHNIYAVLDPAYYESHLQPSVSGNCSTEIIGTRLILGLGHYI